MCPIIPDLVSRCLSHVGVGNMRRCSDANFKIDHHKYYSIRNVKVTNRARVVGTGLIWSAMHNVDVVEWRTAACSQFGAATISGSAATEAPSTPITVDVFAIGDTGGFVGRRKRRCSTSFCRRKPCRQERSPGHVRSHHCRRRGRAKLRRSPSLSDVLPGNGIWRRSASR